MTMAPKHDDEGVDVTEDDGWQDDPAWQVELRDWLIAVDEAERDASP